MASVRPGSAVSPRLPGMVRAQGTAEAPERVASRLEAMGYQPKIAARLARTQPELAQRILTTPKDDASGRRVVRSKGNFDFLNYGPEDGRPVTLYRGVAVGPKTLDLRFSDTRIPGVLFCSEQVSVPFRYATGPDLKGRQAALARGETHGTVLELQVPAFAVRYYGHPVLLTDELPDLAPFLVRSATVDLSLPSGDVLVPEQVRWTEAG